MSLSPPISFSSEVEQLEPLDRTFVFLLDAKQ
jgi:hypothetical protein